MSWLSKMDARSDVLFDSAAARESIGRKTVNGTIFNLLFKGGNTILMVGYSMVIARLIAPQAYGVYALVLAFYSFMQPFCSFGLPKNTIRVKEINRKSGSNIFWINFFTGCFTGIAMFFAGIVMAKLYGIGDLFWLGTVLSVCLVLEGAYIQHDALLIRNMRFKQECIVMFFVKIIMCTTGIGLAYFGYGYWALVFASAVNGVASWAALWCVTGWVPRLPDWSVPMKSHLVFGVNLTLASIVSSISKTFDRLLLGYFFNVTDVGLFQRSCNLSRQLTTQFSDPVRGVLNSSLSRLTGEPEIYRRSFAKAVTGVALATFPLLLFFWVYADAAVWVMFGDRWMAIVPLVRILLIGMVFEHVSRLQASVLVSFGFSRRILFLGMLFGGMNVAAMLIGLTWGMTGLAWGYATASLLYLCPSMWYSFRGTPVSIGVFFRALLAPVLATVLTGVFAWLIRLELMRRGIDFFHEFCIGMSSTALLFCAVVFILPSTRCVMMEVIKLLLSTVISKKAKCC